MNTKQQLVRAPVARLGARAALLVASCAGTMGAQDTRTVKEPVVPAACRTLDAALTLVGDSTISAVDEMRTDNVRIQSAIDGCASGQAVVLRAANGHRAFVAGPIQLKPGVTLVIDRSVVLFASRDPRLFDATPNACGRLGSANKGCRPLISAERANGSGVMGPGTIDGRGWATIRGDSVTWWEMAEQARDTKYSQNNPRLIVSSRTNDFTLYNLTLRNSPNFHVVLERGNGITAWGVTINTPKGARNTDGIDPSGSENVSIVHSNISTGDDNVAIKAGTNGGAKYMTIAHNHMYSGHGVSIGSETDGGASHILVEDVTFDGTDNALRIKSNGSRGGLVDGVTYDNVCIQNVKYPIYMDTHYTASAELDGAKTPIFRNIIVRNTRITGAGTVTLDGYDAARPLEITFDRVIADTPAAIKLEGGRTRLTLGTGGTNLTFPDSVATITGPRTAPAPDAQLSACPARLIPFPGGVAKPVTVRKLAKPAPPSDATTATYANPVLFADFSDPDVIRDRDDFWMTASSFGQVPGLPILHSRDLVHWQVVNYAIPRFADSSFNAPQHGNGVWAPSLRQHDGYFWIFYGDPDRGIYMTKARDPRSTWSPPHLVQAGKGLIDPTPLWDDDGRAYLVHAYARSRSGIKHRLVVHGMRPDGAALLDSGTIVFLDSLHHPTAEGPKFYKRNGWYWIFAPAGGVSTGWQLAMRSKSPLGPYEARTVLSQGATTVNGPHQGAWVSLANGDDWFIHFQDRGAYGRITHLQPMQWRADNWPVIGTATERDTTGSPVASAPLPRVTVAAATLDTFVTSDDFARGKPGLQWQWQANPQTGWLTGNATRGTITLLAAPLATNGTSLWDAPNLLLQKFPSESFDVVAAVEIAAARDGDIGGLIAFGNDYAFVGVRRRGAHFELVHVMHAKANEGGADSVVVLQSLEARDAAVLRLRLRVSPGARVSFAYSVRQSAFIDVPSTFVAQPSQWVGAKFGLFASTGTSAPLLPNAARQALTMTVSDVRVTTAPTSADTRTH